MFSPPSYILAITYEAAISLFTNVGEEVFSEVRMQDPA
jgi:hypothetical protein